MNVIDYDILTSIARKSIGDFMASANVADSLFSADARRNWAYGVFRAWCEMCSPGLTGVPPSRYSDDAAALRVLAGVV